MKTIIMLSLSVLAAISSFGQSRSSLVKKWKIDAYLYMGMSFEPEEAERGDYVHLLQDGTFRSLEEGQPQKGSWKWIKDKRMLVLSRDGESVEIEIVEISTDELILLLEEDGESMQVRYKRWE